MQAWLPVNRKRPGHQELNPLGGGVIILQDDESKQQFFIDTGGAVSFLPHCSPLTPSGVSDSVADGKSIPCCGRLRTFFVTFLLAPVSRPILGLDFLSVHRLLVDPVGHQLLDSKSFKPLAKPPTAAGKTCSQLASTLCSISPTIWTVLAAFPAIIGDRKDTPSRNVNFASPSKRQADLCSPRPAVWIRISYTWRRHSFAVSPAGISAVPTHPGRLCCTWSARKTGTGNEAHGATTELEFLKSLWG
jgi:hypothetical protein